jgi:hypothetical protein
MKLWKGAGKGEGMGKQQKRNGSSFEQAAEKLFLD